ncbi:RRP12-like protein [Diadema antillarum]|uniref:RRP12-like protein n=1 Tax=Diadema antillarum TaxID=105358 RepID=UPI003A8487DE
MTKGPGRVRLARGSAGKGKRWRKGQSCVTNPKKSKHREAAKQNRFLPGNFRQAQKPADGGLTAKALAQHNESQRDDDVTMGGVASDQVSVGGETYGTFLSGVTDCSQPAFNRVRRYWESSSASHKEICAVLAAVTEIIREKGGKESETEYFATLMTTLDTVSDPESISAVLYLLSLVIKRVPSPVLKLKFSFCCQTLMKILAEQSASSTATTTAVVRSTLTCLSTILRVQDPGVWGDASTLQVYHGILSYTTHSKPKVRKAAHHAVTAILRGSKFMTCPDPPSHHPAAGATAKFCVQQIEQHGGTGEASTTCHVLTLLKDILVTFPRVHLKASCETILKVMTLSNVLVTSVSMKALHGMFVMKPSAASLPPDLNAQLINALYKFRPDEGDSQSMLAWLAVMQEAHLNLFRLDSQLCHSHLPRLFLAAINSFLSHKAEVAVSAAGVVKTLLSNCVKPMRESLAADVASKDSTVRKMFQAVQRGLSYKYHSSWGLMMQILAAFYEAFGKEGHSFMAKNLQSICDLRGSQHFAYKHELDKAMGAAILAMGPRLVLQAVPLHITGEEDNYDFPRSWLIPVIRDNVANTELQFFTTYFLPLAAKLRTRSLELMEGGHKVQGKAYDVLQSQIWSLLPGFCKHPTDLATSFKGIAKILGTALNERQDLRLDVCTGLRNLITTNLDNEENRAELARFDKNYLPILFNLYTSGKSRENPSLYAVLETIKVYLQIADRKLIATMADKACQKLDKESPDQQHAVMDLVIAMTPHVDSDHMTKLYKMITPMLQSTDRTMEKKAYRVLEELCEGVSEASQEFLKVNLDDLKTVLLKSLSSSSPSSKAPRLRCLHHIVKSLPTENEAFLVAVLPEVILCTKEINQKARASAFGLLVEIGNTLLQWSTEPREVCVSKYLEMLAAGLAGSPHMVSATVLALTRILFEYKDIMRGVLLEQLVDAVDTLMKAKGREVLKTALGLIKVIATVVPDVALAQHVEKLIQSMAGLKESNRRNLRVPIKGIYSRFVRKFGFEMIRKLIPEHHLKMVQNIKKMQDRTKRHKAMRMAERQGGKGEEGDDEDAEAFDALVPQKPKPESIDEILRETDSEDDENDEDAKDAAARVKGQRAKKQASHQRGKAWLKEGEQDDTPLDFLDPSVTRRVLATKPDASRESQSAGHIKHNFKTLPDGRLLIAEMDDEEAEEKKEGGKKEGKRKGRKRGGGPGDDNDDDGRIDDLEDMMDEEFAKFRISKKRKVEDLSVSDDEDESATKYRAGGSGIHRPIGAAGKEKPASKPGVEYSSKKAGGDVKRKGKQDPYAYIPLSRQQLNKRTKKKASGQWAAMGKAAKKGALKGKRNKKKH